MRPIFTIHAGEFLVGDFIEQHFRNTNVWLPSKDSGVDLLVTNKKNQVTVSLQLKFRHTPLPAARNFHGGEA